jgi:ankyrin repeat protein
MAILFAKNLERALGDEAPESENSYTDNIIQGFKNQSAEVRGLELRKIDPVLSQTIERFKSFAAFKFWLKGVDEKDYEKMAGSYVITMPFMVRMDILSLAIAMDDVSTVRKFAKILLQEKSTSSDDTALIQACRRGNTDIVHALLDAGADPETVTESGCSLYHWLFMLGDGARSIAERLLNSERKLRSNLLNHPCSRPYILHPQWPLELVGTPLAFAILSKSTTAVEVLLDLGALPYVPINSVKDQTSKIPWTPIHLAVKFHLVDILHLLLDRMSLSSPFLSEDGTVEISTFELARSISHSTMVERLAMHSKDIIPALTGTLAELPSTTLSIASNDGLTPFMEAIDFSNLSVVKAMLQFAPELALKRFVDPEDPRLFTYPVIFAAQIAARRESSLALDIVKLLLSHMPRNYLVKDSDGRTPLHLSVTGYSTSTTKWLLENHYSPNLPDNNGRTAVHQARSTASLDVLLGAGADINRADRSGFTCSHLAALQGFEDLVDGFIYRNANLKCIGNIGSPLHCAVLKQSWRVASSLLKAKDAHGKPRVDINATDANGDTAMHLAVKNSGSTDIVRLLFFHGASANIRNKDGLTPLHLLISSGDFESFKAFILAEKVVRDSNNSEIINGALPDAASKRHLSPTFARKVRSGAFSVIDFEMSTDDGRTPFHTAATFASVEIANILRENGAGVNIRDMEGNTVVHLAVLATDQDIAEKGGDRYRFLDNCLSVNLAAENKQGIWPWDLAFQQKNFDLMTYLLREGGAKACKYETFLTRHNGRKILHDAIDANEWKLVNLLLSPVNRGHLFPTEREARSELLNAIGKGGKISTEDQVKKIFEHWLGLFTQETFSRWPIQVRIEALKPGEYSFKQMNSLCMVVNAAANYRALGTLYTMTRPFDAVRHIYNSRYANRIFWFQVSDGLDDLNPFRVEQFTTDLEELKTEAFKRWETVLLTAQFPEILETHSQILSLFRECDLSYLLRLAALTSVLSPDRPIDETEHCYTLPAKSEIIPKILEAISNKDGTTLKESFPIDPNVVIQCCSWANELPSSYD